MYIDLDVSNIFYIISILPLLFTPPPNPSIRTPALGVNFNTISSNEKSQLDGQFHWYVHQKFTWSFFSEDENFCLGIIYLNCDSVAVSDF